jgi:hypothetical protein
LWRLPIKVPALRMARQWHAGGGAVNRGPWVSQNSAISLLTDIAASAHPGDETALKAALPRLVEAASDPRTQPGVAGRLALIIRYTGDTLPTTPPELQPAQLAQLVALTEKVFSQSPEAPQTRVALGIARILQDRPWDTRSLLVNLNISQAPTEHQAIAYAVRALAEIEIGDDLDQARRLVTAANRLHRTDPLVWVAQRALTKIDHPR